MKAIPPYIYKKSNQITMVLFVPLFCMAFIFMYHPEDFDRFDERLFFGLPFSRDTSWHLIIGIMVLIGMTVVALNRLWMNIYTRNHHLTYTKYVLWVLSEILEMSFIYAAISSLISETPFFQIYSSVFFKTIRTLLIPYIMCYVYFIWQEKNSQLVAIKKSIEEDERAQERAYLQLFDERGKMQLSVRKENLLIIESADNYVCVWYMSNEAPKRMMIRNTIKALSSHLDGTHVLRCHRSYMVNMERVKVLRREKEGIFIELGIEGVPDIPISKTYAENIKSWLMS